MVKLLFDEASRLPSKERVQKFWLLWEADRIFLPIPKKKEFLTPTSLDLPPDPHVWETFQYTNLEQKGLKIFNEKIAESKLVVTVLI